MVGAVALIRALAEGGRVLWEAAEKPRLRVSPIWADALRRAAPEVRDVLRRAVAFRKQLESAQGGPIIPYLLMPEAPAPRAGTCISCGAATHGRLRCGTCLAAVYVALDMAPPIKLLAEWPRGA